MGGVDFGGVTSTSSDVGAIAGKGGSILGDFFGKLSLFITRMSVWEWLVLIFIIVGCLIVYYLKKRFNLKFRWSPKSTKKTFN